MLKKSSIMLFMTYLHNICVVFPVVWRRKWGINLKCFWLRKYFHSSCPDTCWNGCMFFHSCLPKPIYSSLKHSATVLYIFFLICPPLRIPVLSQYMLNHLYHCFFLSVLKNTNPVQIQTDSFVSVFIFVHLKEYQSGPDTNWFICICFHICPP